jgi:hypothetical protein
MRGPAAVAVERYLSSTRDECSSEPSRHDCTLRSSALDASLFYGRFPGDDRLYAIAFVSFATGGSGVALSAYLFRSEPNGHVFSFVRAANNIYGSNPRQVKFEATRSISWIGTIARPGDTHANPTGKKLMHLKLSETGLVLDEKR